MKWEFNPPESAVQWIYILCAFLSINLFPHLLFSLNGLRSVISLNFFDLRFSSLVLKETLLEGFTESILNLVSIQNAVCCRLMSRRWSHSFWQQKSSHSVFVSWKVALSSQRQWQRLFFRRSYWMTVDCPTSAKHMTGSHMSPWYWLVVHNEIVVTCFKIDLRDVGWR